MNSNRQVQDITGSETVQNPPWYRQFWPWFIIALPTSAVIGSFVSLWLAVSNPDHLIVTDDEYQQIKSELKAQAPINENNESGPGEAESQSN